LWPCGHTFDYDFSMIYLMAMIFQVLIMAIK
jgi:hypothetical protein